MSFAARACWSGAVRLHAMLLYGSHTAYRCLNAGGCDRCDRLQIGHDFLPATKGCSLSLPQQKPRFLVPYMPLAAHLDVSRQQAACARCYSENDASRINTSRTRRTASAATSCTASGGRSGTSRIERARATSHPPRSEDKRERQAAHEYRNCTREAARSRRIATNSAVRRADYGWTSVDGARVESGG